ncbi:MAG: T9SS type A sorting domain-containing protein [Bacteroidetes bacterium]|nr:T9SS type A sorting domain-containing protein [Bacteroidota bacterium]
MQIQAQKAVWAGLYIKDLEAQTQTNSVISNIITKSLSNRVLSKYTAFICLEDSILFCDDCADESSLVSLEELAEDSVMTSYPNPFNDNVTIKLSVKNPEKYKDAIFTITNILGETVYTFNFSDVNKDDYLEFNWNGKTLGGAELAQGIYIFNIVSSNGSKNVKLIKQ